MDKETQEKLLEKIKADYKGIAQEFSDTRARSWPEMEFLAQYVKKGDKILDLGCGNGRLYGLFKEKEIKYVGVDNSAKLIELAKNQVTKYPSNQVTASFIVGDMTKKLPFDDNYFNIVFMVASFHHIPSEDLRKQVLKEIKRIIKPNGLLIMVNWNLWQLKLIKKYKLWKLLFGLKYNQMDYGDVFIPWKLKSGEIIQRYYHAFTFKEIKTLFKETGWQILEQYYTNSIQKTNWLKGYNLVTIAENALA